MQERECGNTGRKKDYVESLRSINCQPLHNRSLSRNVCAPKAGHQTPFRPVTHPSISWSGLDGSSPVELVMTSRLSRF